MLEGILGLPSQIEGRPGRPVDQIGSIRANLGIAGAAVTAVFVYLIGSAGQGGATPLKLTLAGTATSVAVSAFIIAVVLPRNDIAGSVQSWQVGGIGGASFETLLPAMPFALVGLILAEALFLATCASVLGLGFAIGVSALAQQWLTQTIGLVATGVLPGWQEMVIVAYIIPAALVAGLVPALRLHRRTVQDGIMVER